MSKFDIGVLIDEKQRLNLSDILITHEPLRVLQFLGEIKNYYKGINYKLGVIWEIEFSNEDQKLKFMMKYL